MTPNQPKRISTSEFRRQGYLQELNRQFLHPLGLALEVVVDEDSQGNPIEGTERLGGIWDYREDPEGILFDPSIIDADMAARVNEEMEERLGWREQNLGFRIQPAEGQDHDD